MRFGCWCWWRIALVKGLAHAFLPILLLRDQQRFFSDSPGLSRRNAARPGQGSPKCCGSESLGQPPAKRNGLDFSRPFRKAQHPIKVNSIIDQCWLGIKLPVGEPNTPSGRLSHFGTRQIPHSGEGMDLAGLEPAPVTLMGFRAAVTPQAHDFKVSVRPYGNAWSVVTRQLVHSQSGKSFR